MGTRATNARVGTRAFPGLQGDSKTNCETEGLSEGARAQGWRRARNGEGQKSFIYFGNWLALCSIVCYTIIMTNTTNTTTEDDIQTCEDCGVWSCDCFCDEIADQHREIARGLY